MAKLPEVRRIFEQFLDLEYLDYFFEPFYRFMSVDSEKFIEECGEHNRSDFFMKSLYFERTFQKSFIKSIKSVLTERQFNDYAAKIEDNMYFLAAKYCSKNILSIVLDFPEDPNSIIYLKKCLDKTNIIHEMAERLTREVERRLLIPGIVTQTILSQYINMLKVLQILDPQGLVF